MCTRMLEAYQECEIAIAVVIHCEIILDSWLFCALKPQLWTESETDTQRNVRY